MKTVILVSWNTMKTVIFIVIKYDENWFQRAFIKAAVN